MVDFIHNNKELYGVEAICRILPIAPSTYYRTLDLCDENPEHRAKRDLHDLHHAEEIKRIWKESSGRYGVRKVWQKLKREGYIIARCTVARLMKKLGIQGVWRGKNKQTTRSRDDQKRADDLVKRNFTADHPDQAVLLRSVTLRIFKQIQAGSIPPLLLMCSHEQLLDGKYLHG
jgi:transposase InsO family protein